MVAAPCLLPIRAEAQIRRSAWGLYGTVAPKWTLPDYQYRLYEVDAATLEGAEFAVGVVRGRAEEGHWGFSYFQRSVRERSRIERGSGPNRTVLEAVSGGLRGVEFHGLAPFVTVRRRVQVGLFLGAGIAQWTTRVTETRDGVTIGPSHLRLLPNLVGRGTPRAGTAWEHVDATVRIELGGTLVLSPFWKVTASGGLALPGSRVFNVGLIYFFPTG
jgi:hypothetical protein